MITETADCFCLKDTYSDSGYKCSKSLSKQGNPKTQIKKPTKIGYVDVATFYSHSCVNYNIRTKQWQQ